jgi:L-arabinonolactonase
VSSELAEEQAATCVLPAAAQLGECPTWSPSEGLLYWVDIDGRAVHRFDPVTGQDEQRATPGRPGSIALTGSRGQLLVALEHRLTFLDWPSGAIEDWLELEPDGLGTRLNDGRCDPTGRFWVGSMTDKAARNPGRGTLYRIDPDGTVEAFKTDIGVSNALAFSPDGRTMYFADTHRDVVWAYDYDASSGTPSRERVFLDFADLPGRPDGACVDADGCYWIACVYGSAVLRFRPDGRIDRRVRLSAPKPTMPAFGGASMTTLFVTTIGGGGSHDIDPAYPDAGGIFALETDVLGLPETPFGGALQSASGTR